MQAQSQAEAAYQTAIQVAQSQNARIFELRSATSLARLWCLQARTHIAHALLDPLLASFTEGAGTPDLLAAGAVLDQIKAQMRQLEPSR